MKIFSSTLLSFILATIIGASLFLVNTMAIPRSYKTEGVDVAVIFLSNVTQWLIDDHCKPEVEIAYPYGTYMLSAMHAEVEFVPIYVTVARLDENLVPAVVDVVVRLLWIDIETGENRTICEGNAALTSPSGIVPEVTFYWEWNDPYLRVDNYNTSYLIWANVTAIEIPDINPENNMLINGVVDARFLCCDIHGNICHIDACIELMDFWNMCQAYGSTPSNPRWNPSCDVCNATTSPAVCPTSPDYIGDGFVELMDLWCVSTHFGDSLGWC